MPFGLVAQCGVHCKAPMLLDYLGKYLSLQTQCCFVNNIYIYNNVVLWYDYSSSSQVFLDVLYQFEEQSEISHKFEYDDMHRLFFCI